MHTVSSWLLIPRVKYANNLYNRHTRPCYSHISQFSNEGLSYTNQIRIRASGETSTKTIFGLIQLLIFAVFD